MVASWLFVAVIALSIATGVMAIYQLQNAVIYVQEIRANVKKSQIPKPIPTQAKEVANTFTSIWLSDAYGNDTDKKIDWLKPYISAKFESFLSANNAYLVKFSKEPIKVTQLFAFDEAWAQEDKKARVKLRVHLNDGRILYFECPVVRSGSGWFVDQFPSVVDPPKKDLESEKAEEIPLDDKKQEKLKTTLANFMQVWMKGEPEAVQRYTLDKKSIPSTQLPTAYKELKSIQVLSRADQEYIVRVWIAVEDQSKSTMTLSYDVKVMEKEKDWFIVSVNK